MGGIQGGSGGYSPRCSRGVWCSMRARGDCARHARERCDVGHGGARGPHVRRTAHYRPRTERRTDTQHSRRGRCAGTQPGQRGRCAGTPREPRIAHRPQGRDVFYGTITQYSAVDMHRDLRSQPISWRRPETAAARYARTNPPALLIGRFQQKSTELPIKTALHHVGGAVSSGPNPLRPFHERR